VLTYSSPGQRNIDKEAQQQQDIQRIH